AYHLGKKALDDENVSHSSQGPQMPVTSIEGQRSIEGQSIDKDGLPVTHPLDQATPYEYRPVDANDYVSATPAKRQATKELD
ncbi:MAG: hypothetical protein Q4P13_10650, partial [Psychrobacter sp.]|nr:hypothetical protein [Psychrobacter sp.]